jgi:hypothetical protein
MELSSVISKVQKLLSLANSSNANEAATAAALANKLIDQYRLSSADYTMGETEVDPLIEDNDYIYETGRIVPWKSSLVLVLAKHYGCAVYNSAYYPNGRKASRYKLVGRASDIEITKYMFNWLMLECQRLSENEARGKGRVFASSYCQGFVSGIRQQLSKSRQEAKENASQISIVKIDSRESEATEFMHKMHNLRKTHTTSSSMKLDVNAFNAGADRGKSLHLGQSMGSGCKVKMLNG